MGCRYDNDDVGMWWIHKRPSQRISLIFPPRLRSNFQNRHPPRTQRLWNIIENRNATRVDRRAFTKFHRKNEADAQNLSAQNRKNSNFYTSWEMLAVGSAFDNMYDYGMRISLSTSKQRGNRNISNFTSGHFNKFMLELLNIFQTTGIIWQSILNIGKIE